MFASLVLALSLVPGVPAADQVVCPRSHGAPVAALSDESLTKGLDAWWNGLELTVATVTQATDAMRYGALRGAWFQGHSGGSGNGERAVYDPQRGLFLACVHYDTALGIVVSRMAASAVPREVPRERVSFASARGIGIGSSAARVRAIYGQAPLVRVGAKTFLAYKKPTTVGRATYWTLTFFWIVDGRVAGIDRSSGV